MDPTFQTTSFIPKKPLTTVRPKASSTVSLFTLIAVAILVITIAFSVFTYFWKTKLDHELATLQNTIELATEKFNPTVLKSLQQLDRQISTAETLLNNHITLSPILVNVLNANTLTKVQYTSFTHTVTGTGPNAKIQVKLSGKAITLPYVAQQSKKLAENQYVKNPLFSDIVTAKDNTVTFNLVFDLAPSLISYSQVVASMNGTARSITTDTTTSNSAQGPSAETITNNGVTPVN